MNNTDKKTCSIVQDLLPLYHDDVCSEESKRIVEEHLAVCGDCKKIADDLNNDITEKDLNVEAKGVIRRHQRKEGRKSALAGSIVAGVLMIPIVVCLIVNLATGHGLSWFFIVLASLLVAASLTLPPLLAVGKEKKFLWTTGLFMVSLLVLLMVIAIYVRGNWFFIATVPSLIGLSMIFVPIVLAIFMKKGPLSKCKGLFSMLWETLMTILLVGGIGAILGSSEYFRIATPSTALGLGIAWIVFLFLRYVKFSKAGYPGFVKAGIVTAFFGIVAIPVSDIVNSIVYQCRYSNLEFLNLALWNDKTVNANVYMIILLTTIVIGLLLIVTGITGKKEK